MNKTYPKISIVTPNFNMGYFLEQTILSVINQNYPNLEYIIIDGGSTDNSVEIIKKYEKYLTYWVSEKDSGLYNALNKGFKVSTGEIMMYINSDDIIHPNSLKIIAKVFTQYPEVNWISGYNTWINEEGEVIGIQKNKDWSIIDYYNGKYEWIQQESTVWKRDLWEKAGGEINQNYLYAGDLELWSKFFLNSKLIAGDFLIGSFRVRKNQISQVHIKKYHLEASLIINEMKKKVSRQIKIKSFLYKIIKITIVILEKSRIFNHALILKIPNKLIAIISGKNKRIFYNFGEEKWFLG